MQRLSKLFFFFYLICSTYQSSVYAQEGKFEYMESTQTNVTFSNSIQENEEFNIFTNMYIYNGGGVAVGDLNNDLLPDLYFVGNQSPNRLYLNGGNFDFYDYTVASKTGGKDAWDTAVSIVDINGDGWNDIYICHAGNYLGQESYLYNIAYINNGDAFQNNGVPTFSNQAEQLGIQGAARSTQALFFDYDNDNDLDLYVVNHPYNFFLPIDMRVEAESSLPDDATDRLYKNVNGLFVDVTEDAGIKNWAFGLSASMGDFNQDGWLDIYLANDFSEKDIMYVNQQNGTFKQEEDKMLKHMSNFSMGSAIADINNDLLADIFVVDMMANDNKRRKENMSPMAPEVFWDNVSLGRHYQYMQNTLQLNNGNNTFSELAQLSGLANTDWSWSTIIEDIDNDGWKDFWITNGILIDYRNADANKKVLGKHLNNLRDSFEYYAHYFPSTPLQNYCFRNSHDLTFEDKSSDWGLFEKGFSNGSVLVDLDKDGDLDIVVNNTNSKASIIRNNLKPSNNYIRLIPKGPERNINGIGLKATLYIEDRKQCVLHSIAKGFQSSSESVIHFGIGAATIVDSIELTWPDKKMQILRNVSGRQELVVNYKDAFFINNKYENELEPLLQKSKDLKGIDFIHEDLEYDDFNKELLLPHKYSQLGPSIAAADVNNDDLVDVLLGGGAGQAPMLYIQNALGRFSPSVDQDWNIDKDQETTAIHFFDVDGDLDMDVYLGNGSNEWAPSDAMYKDCIYLNDGQGNFTKTSNIPMMHASTSAVISADVDLDGDLDLFVGGRLVPGRYPQAANSYLLKNEGGQFLIDTQGGAFENLGLLSDAKWADLDQNGFPDLCVLGEWMPLTIFWNDGKAFNKKVFTGTEGWWSSLEIADLNADGWPDIIGGNLGLNTKFKADTSQPISVFYDDFDQNGSLDIILGYNEEGKTFPVRGRQCSSQQIPIIAKQFPSYADFSIAEIDDILGMNKKTSKVLEAYRMESTYWLNKGRQQFDQKAFPNSSQISIVQDIEVLDVNNDAYLDIVLLGNRYQTEVETVRQDASIGQVLLGNSNGDFTALAFKESGLDASGDIRKTCIVELKDRSKLLLITQNNGPLQLFVIHEK